MRGHVLSLGVLAWVAAVAGWAMGAEPAKPAGATPATATPTAAKPAAGQTGELIVGEPIHFANLTIFPIESRTPKTQKRFITLDEGLKAGTVSVMELGTPAAAQGQNQAADSADVNRLALINGADQPLYLMPGEIIVGGQQDRTIAQEYVIPPGKKPVEIEVFCVEHGRWVGRGVMENTRLVNGANVDDALAETNGFAQRAGGRGANAAAGQAAANSAAQPDEGKFIGSVGNVNKAARIAVQHAKDQNEVWRKVAGVNALNGVKAGSGAFSGNYVEGEAVRRLVPYVKALDRHVAESSNVIGVAVAIDGRMDTLDVFESTPLFRQLWPKLLKSYALDAVNAAEEAAADKRPVDTSARSNGKEPLAKPEPICTVDEARKFLAEAMSAKPQTSTTNGNVTVTTLATDHILTFSAQDSRRSADSQSQNGGGLGGFGGGAIHAFGGAF